ncbi:MAG: 6-carboxytetrahydropterin synthase QueD [Candidatus Schekmanbacteria bacterium]|nr:MAG: 6-carboxytetrahydropterin synthase QueD [Candidatus Schekmanbacteria bacterium]
MYSVSIKLDFSSAHQLRNYKGKCEALHGHNWKVEAVVSGEKLNSLGMLIDFHDLKKELSAVLELLDHKNLNETEIFKEINPTAENIANWIYDEMSKKINNGNISVSEIRVWESEHSCAMYSGKRC